MKRIARWSAVAPLLAGLAITAPLAVELSPPKSADESNQLGAPVAVWTPESAFEPAEPVELAPEPQLPAPPTTAQQFRNDLMDLVDVTLEYAKEGGLPAYFVTRLEQDRDALYQVTMDEYEELAPELAQPIAELSRVVAWLDPRLPVQPSEEGVDKTPGLPGANYPQVNWTFFIDAGIELPDGEAGNVRRSGLCSAPRRNPALLFTSLNAVLVNEAIRDVSDQICNQSALGANLSLACIITDIAYLVQRGIFDNLLLCEDLIDDAEVQGSYRRLEHIHGDIELTEMNLTNEVDSAETSILNQLSSTQTAIQNQLTAAEAALKSEIDANEALINQLLGAIGAANDRLAEVQAVQRQIVKLLLTPQGNRVVNPEVLTCVGEACPNVLACPGEECSFPIGPMPPNGTN